MRPETGDTDARVIERLLARDEAAFADLVATYHSSLMRLALTFVSDHGAAEEVVQETWLGVVKGLAAFERRSSLKTWIFRILVNRARTRGGRDGRLVNFSAFGDVDDEPSAVADRFSAEGRWIQPPSMWHEQNHLWCRSSSCLPVDFYDSPIREASKRRANKPGIAHVSYAVSEKGFRLVRSSQRMRPHNGVGQNVSRGTVHPCFKPSERKASWRDLQTAACMELKTIAGRVPLFLFGPGAASRKYFFGTALAQVSWRKRRLKRTGPKKEWRSCRNHQPRSGNQGQPNVRGKNRRMTLLHSRTRRLTSRFERIPMVRIHP